jgi:CRP-like cAMP-binding protein
MNRPTPAEAARNMRSSGGTTLCSIAADYIEEALRGSEALARQLRLSMEHNARMTNRLKQLLAMCNNHQPSYEAYDAVAGIEAILRDENP